MHISFGWMALWAAVASCAGQEYTISTYAGGAVIATPVLATQTPIGNAAGIALDAAGNVYFSSGGASNHSVFKIESDGMLTRVAGTGRIGYGGDGMAAKEAQLANPLGLAFDAAGNLYIADSWNCVVRMVSPDGVISTAVGNGWQGYSGDGGQANWTLR